MRRNAIHFSGILIGLIAFVVLSLFATAGKAAGEEPHRSSAALPPMLMATPIEPVQQVQSAQSVPSVPSELLHEFSTVSVPAAVPLAKRPHTLLMEVTAYCPCRKCCGKNARGITASGLRVTHNDGLFVAADASVFSFHTKLLIPGYADGAPVPVLDRGGAIKGNRLDVFFPTHEQAREWGRRMVEVTILD
jgi:3D (Asp-Asp-Asp) domain-containing protein